jgi:hypothetical protein
LSKHLIAHNFHTGVKKLTVRHGGKTALVAPYATTGTVRAPTAAADSAKVLAV